MTNRIWHISASLLALLASSPALAQAETPAAQAEADESTSDDGALNTIVVTAQKRSENLQDVPIAITTLDGAALANRGIVNVAQLGTVAPGLNFRANRGQFQPTIRGIGTNAGFAENPVSLYVDGVYIPQQLGALVDLNDVEQVSVLKGPQGTLFGRNSTAGVVQIETRRPSHQLGGEVQASIDDYQTLRSNAYLSGGLGDKAAASLSVVYDTQGVGWGKDYTTGQDVGLTDHAFSSRGKLLFEPGDDTEIVLIGQYSDQDSITGSFKPYPGTRFSYPGAGPYRSRYDTYANRREHVRVKTKSASATLDHDFGFASLRSISSFRRLDALNVFDGDGTAAPLFLITIDSDSTDYTQELQLASPKEGPVKWLVGGYYIHIRDRVQPAQIAARPPFTPAVATIVRQGAQTIESFAGFGQLSWEFSSGTTLTGGARYSTERRHFDAFQSTTLGTSAPVVVPVDRVVKVHKPTFRVALDHKFSDDILGYVSFNTGFKSGGFNLLAPATPPYAPETIKSYEAGLKTELFDRRVRFNVGGFYYDYSNVQISQVINNASTVSNAASARLYGVDVDFEALLATGLQLSGGFEVLDAKFTKFDNAQVARPNPAGGAFVTSGSAKGNRLPLSQNFAANAALDYDTGFSGADLHFNVTGSYQGGFFFEPDNFAHQPAYFLLNASARVTLPGSGLSVTLWGRNMFDEAIITAAGSSRTGINSNYDAAPRTYGVTALYKF